MTFLSELPWWIQCLSAIFVIAWLIQLLLHLTIWQRLWRRVRSQKKEQVVAEANAVFAEQTELPGVSILVYAHNQGELLLRNLPMLLEQDYPNFDVTVMDDASLDDCCSWLKKSLFLCILNH